MTTQGMKIYVKVPKKYAKRKYLDAIGMGLMDLALGAKVDPDEIPTEEGVTQRLTLSPKGIEFWKILLPWYDGNKRKLVREALYLVAQEPEHCLRCRI